MRSADYGPCTRDLLYCSGKRQRGAFASGCGEYRWAKGREGRDDDDVDSSKEFRQVPLPGASGNVRLVSAGSKTFAVVTEDNRAFVWGENRSGNLGLGRRHLRGPVESPREIVGEDGRPWFEGGGDGDWEIVRIECTRGQPVPKNNLPDPTGQVNLAIYSMTRAQCVRLQGRKRALISPITLQTQKLVSVLNCKVNELRRARDCTS